MSTILSHYWDTDPDKFTDNELHHLIRECGRIRCQAQKELRLRNVSVEPPRAQEKD